MKIMSNIQSRGLFDLAYDCLNLDHPQEKVALTLASAQAWETGRCALSGDTTVERLECPGRPETPVLVETPQLPARKLGSQEGHAAFMHAIAHIEFNAINLAWDAVYRFRSMPRGFYDDWVRIAREEASHFEMVRDYLLELGYDYGSFNAHNHLWEMALDTDNDALMRMALVPRVLEARGLDVTPGMIKRLRHQDYKKAVSILQVIYDEEIGHVEAGSRWFKYICSQQQLDPDTTYRRLVKQYAKNKIRKPINDEARLQAGFSEEEIAYLYSLV